MKKEKLITDITKLALDFWSMNLHNGTFESHLRTLINEYDVAINVTHSSLKLEDKCKMSFGSWKQSKGLTYGYGKYIDKQNKDYTIDEVDEMYESYYNL